MHAEHLPTASRFSFDFSPRNWGGQCSGNLSCGVFPSWKVMIFKFVLSAVWVIVTPLPFAEKTCFFHGHVLHKGMDGSRFRSVTVLCLVKSSVPLLLSHTLILWWQAHWVMWENERMHRTPDHPYLSACLSDPERERERKWASKVGGSGKILNGGLGEWAEGESKME